MRKEGSNATLGEVLGKGAKEGRMYTVQDLPELLGEKMIDIEYSPVGRIRLIQALQNRFGDGFRNVPGVRYIMDDFDKELKVKMITKEK